MKIVTQLLVFAFFAQGVSAADFCSPYKMLQIPVRTESLEASSFLWRLRKTGSASPANDSYLVGTFHTTQVIANWEGLSLLFPELHSFVSETDFSPESGREFAKLSVGESENLKTFLNDDFLQFGQKIASKYGLNLATSNLKPWAAFLALARPTNETASLDSFLQNQARAHSLPLVGLQSSAEMVASIESLSNNDQVQILKEVICNYDEVQKQALGLEKLYSADRVEDFLAEADRLSSPISGLTEKMNDALVAHRNRIFLPRLTQALDQGRALVAVGAAHLFGAGGLIALLRAQGFDVTAMDRSEFMHALLSDVNRETPAALESLLTWLKSNTNVPSEFEPPRVRVISSLEMNQHGCDSSCAFTESDGTIWISQMIWPDFKNGDPDLQADVLSLLIRDVQRTQAPNEKSCVFWQQKNIESLLLRTRFLGSRGAPAVGLKVLPISNCTGG